MVALISACTASTDKKVVDMRPIVMMCDAYTPSFHAFFSEGEAIQNDVQLRNTKMHLETPSPCESWLRGDSLVRNPSIKICIVGHVDPIGREANNDDLSRRRAEDIAELAISAGIPRESVIVAWWGSRHPLIVPSDKPDPRNRRVEVHRCDSSFQAGQRR